MTVDAAARPKRRRLSPDARRRELLVAARSCIARDGLAGFTMEAVAREAGVTGGLPRHYFGTREGMVIALAEEVLGELQQIFAEVRPDGTFQDTVDAYLDWTEKNPWGHAMWMHAPEVHPEFASIVQHVRRHLAALAAGSATWADVPRRRQIAAIGYLGFVESVVADWIADDFADRATVAEVLVDARRRFDAREVGEVGDEARTGDA